MPSPPSFGIFEITLASSIGGDHHTLVWFCDGRSIGAICSLRTGRISAMVHEARGTSHGALVWRCLRTLQRLRPVDSEVERTLNGV
jgi:hypothetical protein